MKEMKHKNVVEMYDVYDVGWMTCIFMEISEGGDLLGVSCQGYELFWSKSYPLMKVAEADLHRQIWDSRQPPFSPIFLIFMKF